MLWGIVFLQMTTLFFIFLCTSMHHLKVGQEDCVGTSACNVSINSEGLALQDIPLVGGIRLNYNRFRAKSLNVIMLAMKVLQKYPAHHWG